VPLQDHVLEVLREHQSRMQQHGMDVEQGLVFLSPRSLGNLYDGLLEKVWKRSQRRVGVVPRRLYAVRHSFLSHALALGNSPADLAAMAGHRTEELLKTYAKPTGRVKLPCWSS
jgi:integrase